MSVNPIRLTRVDWGASVVWAEQKGENMADEQIKIVFEPTEEEGIYRAVCIEDENGNVLKGTWQDTRPWHKEHRVRVIWADEPHRPEKGLHQIIVDDQDVSDALEKKGGA